MRLTATATVLAISGLAAAAALLLHPYLPAPEVGWGRSPSEWIEAPPEMMFIHLAWLLLLALAIQLIGTELVDTAANLVGRHRPRPWSSPLSLRLIGRIGAGTATGLGVVAGATTVAVAVPNERADTAPLLRVMQSGSTSSADLGLMRLLPVDLYPAVGASAPSEAPAVLALRATWVVRPGDSFWAIAEAHLGLAADEADPPSIAAYWLRLIELNRHKLADPQDPDLIFTGQVIDLPPR